MARRPKAKPVRNPVAEKRYAAGSYNFLLKGIRKGLDSAGVAHKLAVLPGESGGS